MKATLIILSTLLLATSASAFELTIVIPPGDGLTRLAQLCEWEREEASKPEMTNDECGYRLFQRGAFERHHEKARHDARRIGQAALRDADEQFWIDLPVPPDGEPPTPTPAP